MLVTAGMFGVLLGMLNYWLLVSGRVVSDGPAYLWINIVAAVLVLLSLLQQFNLPALAINAFYVGVSAWGLFKIWRSHATRLADQHRADAATGG